VNVVLLDYGAGNVSSVAKALTAAGARPRLTSAPNHVRLAQALVIPGVGHFASTAGISPALRAAVTSAIDHGAWVLGICLGLQWLFDGSDEALTMSGLGLFEGRCFGLAPRDGVKVPHVGWNTLDRAEQPSPLLDGIAPGSMAYFAHSFAAPIVGATKATTRHGVNFSTVVERGRVFGVQFHPEKSGATGLRVLANFLEAARNGAPC
jgi:glutamine amidotransferase